MRAQSAFELRLLLRNGENLLVTLGIPAALLVFLTLVPVLPTAGARRVDYLAPGILALAVLSTAFVSLAISTGFERGYLVLKRLGATPLTRVELVAAKALAVLAVEVLQMLLLVAVAVALGWRPHASGVLLALGPLLLGTAAFAGLALALAGTAPALTTLALANAVYVALLLVSGIVFPLALLPGWLATAARVLPAAPLAALLRAVLDAGDIPLTALVTLCAWAVAAPLLAARVFRWE